MRGKRTAFQKVASRMYESIAIPAVAIGVSAAVYVGYQYQQKQAAKQQTAEYMAEAKSHDACSSLDPNCSQRAVELPASKAGSSYQKVAQKAVEKEKSEAALDCKIESFVKEVSDQADQLQNQLSQVYAVLTVNRNLNPQSQNCVLAVEGLMKKYAAMEKEPKTGCRNNYDQENDLKIKNQNLLAAFNNKFRAEPDCAQLASAMSGEERKLAAVPSGPAMKSASKKKKCEVGTDGCDEGIARAVK